jgi:signal transduction histidine kinase
VVHSTVGHGTTIRIWLPVASPLAAGAGGGIAA